MTFTNEPLKIFCCLEIAFFFKYTMDRCTAHILKMDFSGCDISTSISGPNLLFLDPEEFQKKETCKIESKGSKFIFRFSFFQYYGKG